MKSYEIEVKKITKMLSKEYVTMNDATKLLLIKQLLAIPVELLKIKRATGKLMVEV